MVPTKLTLFMGCVLRTNAHNHNLCAAMCILDVGERKLMHFAYRKNEVVDGLLMGCRKG